MTYVISPINMIHRQAVIEGSLPLIGRAPPEPSGAGWAAREGEITSAQDQSGGGRGVLAGENSGEENGDVTGGRRGGLGCMGTSDVETTSGLE